MELFLMNKYLHILKNRKKQQKMNKFNEIYNTIITEWNFSKDKTKLKCFWDEADKLLSPMELIEKYIDYSDTDWKYCLINH